MARFQTRIFLVFVLTLFYSFCLAQSNYQKGFIVNTNGDTLSGLINYKEWYKTPRRFSFKRSAGDKNTIYTANNLDFLHIDGRVTYVKFAVQVSMNEVQFTRITQSTSEPKVQDTVFLRLLVKGEKVSLYAYRDDVKQRFYVLEKDQKAPVELSYKAALVNGTAIKFNAFQPQLIKLAEKFDDSASSIRPLINNSNYSEKDIVSIITLINGQVDVKPAAPVERVKSRRFYLAAGLDYSTIKYTDKNLITANGVDANDNRLYKDRKTSSLLPLISVGTDIYFKREVERFYLRLDASAAGLASEVKSLYKFSLYSAEELSNTYTLSAAVISFRPQVMLNMVNTKIFKCYIGAGPSFHYLVKFKNEMYQKTNQTDPAYSDKRIKDYAVLKDVFGSMMVRGGVIIHKKLDLSVCGYNPLQLNNNMESTISAKYNAFQFSAAYRF